MRIGPCNQERSHKIDIGCNGGQKIWRRADHAGRAWPMQPHRGAEGHQCFLDSSIRIGPVREESLDQLRHVGRPDFVGCVKRGRRRDAGNVRDPLRHSVMQSRDPIAVCNVHLSAFVE